MPRDDAAVGVSGRYPVEEGAVVQAALRRARDLHAEPPEPNTISESAAAIEEDRGTSTFGDADALLVICEHYLATAGGQDVSGEDRHLVVVEVAAEQLAGRPYGLDGEGVDVPDGASEGSAVSQNVPAGTREASIFDVPDGTPPQDTATREVPDGTVVPGLESGIEGVAEGTSTETPPVSCADGSGQTGTSDLQPAADPVPGGTSAPEAGLNASGVPGGTPAPQTPADPRDVPGGPPDGDPITDDRGWARGQKCRVRGVGGIEPETARRLICTGTLLGAVVDAHGDVLALGRTRRLVSKAQRRALMLRDETCRFPGCTRRSHLQAHHRISWADGGVTDLENLLMLCQFHHTTVHEGGISIVHTSSGDWEFLMPDGQSIATEGWRVPTADRLTRELTETQPEDVDHVDSYVHPDAIRIRPQQYGERFSLHDSVQALFGMLLPQDQQAA